MIPTLTFGRTGHESRKKMLMPQWTSSCKTESTMWIQPPAMEKSEQLLGDWIRRHGRPFFLATKTGERTKQAAYDQIRRSLDLLHVDQVDMIQLHALHEEPDWETAFGSGGVVEAVIQAREEGWG